MQGLQILESLRTQPLVRMDSWIQQMIRDNFTDCTVLTITHRLHTIIDSKKVMVMDAGRLKEFGSPFKLLKDPETIFSDLVNQTGAATYQLKKMEEEAFYEKNKEQLKKLSPGSDRKISREVQQLNEMIVNHEDPCQEDECTRLKLLLNETHCHYLTIALNQ